MQENEGIAIEYQAQTNDFQQFLQTHLDQSHPCVVNFCFEHIVDFMLVQKPGGDLRQIKTETLKQKKALESILDLMQWNEKHQPSITLLQAAIPMVSAIADIFPVEAFTRKDFPTEVPIYSLPDHG